MKNLSITKKIPFLTNLEIDFSKLSWFTLVFGFVKLNAFTAALFLSNFVANVSDYGLFEYALTIGFMVAIPLDFGLNGAYPFFNIKLGKKDYKSVFYFHGLLMGGLMLSIFGIHEFIYSFLHTKYVFALLIGGIVSVQALSSSILKSHEVLIKAVIFDGGLFIALNAYNLWLYLSGGVFDVDNLQNCFALYLLLLTGAYAFLFWKEQSDFSLKKYFETLEFGRHIVFSAFLIICLTGSARIFIEWFLDLEAVGYYGIYFRFAAMTVMLHQIVNIVFFKKMYQAEAQTLDKYFAIFLQVLVVGALVLWQIIPPLFSGFITLLQDSYETYQSLYLILSFQMIFWIALALNENIIYREELSKEMNKGLSLIILGMAGGMYALYQMALLDIFNLTLINMLAIFLATEYQFSLLKQKNIRLTKMRLTARGILLFFGILYVFV